MSIWPQVQQNVAQLCGCRVTDTPMGEPCAAIVPPAVPWARLYVPLSDIGISPEAWAVREASRERERVRLRSLLENAAFVAKANPAVVDEARQKLAGMEDDPHSTIEGWPHLLTLITDGRPFEIVRHVVTEVRALRAGR